MKEKPQKGRAIAVGSETKYVREGSILLHRKLAGVEIEIEGVKHLIMKEDDCLGSIE